MKQLDEGKQSVSQVVVAAGLCAGCGVCSAICPASVLAMHFNPRGEFVPVVGAECKNCGLCLKVCPQWRAGLANLPASLTTAPSSLLGESDGLTTWVGYANDLAARLKSSSGGMLTLFLSHLLASRQIDATVVVGPARPDSGRLFAANLVRSQEELSACAGSKYYPMEFSRALKQLQKEDCRTALVGLPCHVKGVRAAMAVSPSLKKNIRFVFGLTCGHGVSALFTEFLAASARVKSDDIDSVYFRDKKGGASAFDYKFSIITKADPIIRSLAYLKSSYQPGWSRHLFVPLACDFCPDVFAEQADATFMDAWLPEYVGDPHGTSLVIARNPLISSLLTELAQTD